MMKQKVLRTIKAVGSSCPYTMLGKKVVEVASQKTKRSAPSCRQQKWRGMVRNGRNIALIGVFCPFFWISVFSGASVQMIGFNAVHSGIVILIGLGIMTGGYLMLRRTRGLTAIESRSPGPDAVLRGEVHGGAAQTSE